MKVTLKIFLSGIILGLLSHSVQAQDFIYINDNNKDQSGTPSKSFQYVKEVRLTNFNVNGANGAWYAKPADVKNAPQTLSKNFVRVETIIKPGGISTEAEITDLTVDQKSTSYSYFDGLGRTIQQVNQKASPVKNDVVKFNTYENIFGREVFKYLDYVSKSANGSYKENAVSEQTAFYLSGGTVAVDQKPYSKNTFDDSPLNQIKKTYSPGWSWHDDGGDNKPVTSNIRFNEANEIYKIIYVEGGVPKVSDDQDPSILLYHKVNTLQIAETIDEDGQVKRTYTNFRGQVVVERVGAGTDWNDTYHVYDYVGNLVYVFPPEASARFAEYNASSNKQNFLDVWTFQYQYDEYGRVVAKRIPGYVPTTSTDLNVGWYSMIYDRWDRVVFTQEPNQYSSNSSSSQWTYTKYDAHNRPIMTGFVTGAKSTLKTSVQNSTVHHEDRSPNAIGYTNSSFPSHSEANLITVNYYDDYAFRNYSGWDAEGFTYTAFNETDIVDRSKIFTEADQVRGYTTGSKVKILDANPIKWLNTVTYYDKKYNVVQTIAENQLGGLDKVSTLYDEFTGTEKIAKRAHTTPGNSLTVVEKYYYDHAQRLTKVTHQINSMPEIVMVSNKYNELGQLIEKNLHSTDNGINFLQSVDMRYNVKGWITHINNSTLTSDANNDDTNDLFGMELLYNEAPNVNNGAITTKKMYDGNISAIKWKIVTQPEEKIYGFNYDIFKRFKQAYYATKNASDWTGNAGKFNETVTVYDKNGNIGYMTHPATGAGLIRNGLSNGAPVEIDNLAYKYVGNQLKNVQDATTNAMGFEDKGLTVNDEYYYDANGNLKEDRNKFITNVLYNHLNRPKEIEITRIDLGNRQDRIKYTYDALGNKLSKEVLIGGISKWKTEYIGSLQYDKPETGSYRISFLSTPEGRAVNNGSSYDYEYFLSDHQKNVRVVFGLKKETDSYRATMEELSVDLKNYEESTFKNIAERRLPIGNTSLNYTEPSENTLVPNQSAKTNANAGQPIGPGKYLRVLTGDAVYMEAYAKYQQPTQNNATIAAAVLGAAVNTAFAIPAEKTTLINGINSNAAAAAGSVLAGTEQPKAYLVYLFFDDNDIYQGGAASGISSTAAGQFQKLTRSFTADRNGHLYIYLANESNVSTADVYFDDFYIVHQKNNSALQVVQASDYYPYGLSFNEYHADRLRTVGGVHEPTLRNRYLFQGQELQKDLDVDWYHYTFRMHDPGMGRFAGVDPLAEKYMYNSTYAFSENRLMEGIELEGAELLNTVNRFEFMDNPASYPVTYVNNFAVDLVNFGIGFWNAGFQTSSTIYNEGFTSYLSGLKSEAIDLGLGIKNKVSSDINYVGRTPWDQQLQGMWTAAKQPESYQNAFSTGLSLLLTKQFNFSSATPNVAPTTKFIAPSGAQYSVAYEMKLPTNLYPGKGYRTHFQAANTSLSNAIASDATFANTMSNLGIVIPRSSTGAILGRSPTNWVWHHDIGTGVMQLVPKIQHNTGSMYWGTLHPGGTGGMAIWGK